MAEAWRDQGLEPSVAALGEPMASDHRRILATAMSRLRGKIKYRPVVFELMASEFTLSTLQKVVESIAAFPLHKQNFPPRARAGGLCGRDRPDGGAHRRAPGRASPLRREPIARGPPCAWA